MRWFFGLAYLLVFAAVSYILWHRSPIWGLVYTLGTGHGFVWATLIHSGAVIERPPPSTECPDVDFGRKP